MLLECGLKKCLLSCLFLIVFVIAPLRVASQSSTAYTPSPGSTERKEILDIFRNNFKKNLQVDVIFVVGHFKIKNGWAWIEITGQSKDGQNRYEPMEALLHKTKGTWKIIDYAPGECTGDEEDSPDCDPKHLFKTLRSKYKAPPEIFPTN